MAGTHIKFPVTRAMKNITLTVDLTWVRTWRVRLWIGQQLIKLAALVIGCGIRVDRDIYDRTAER